MELLEREDDLYLLARCESCGVKYLDTDPDVGGVYLHDEPVDGKWVNIFGKPGAK